MIDIILGWVLDSNTRKDVRDTITGVFISHSQKLHTYIHIRVRAHTHTYKHTHTYNAISPMSL